MFYILEFYRCKKILQKLQKLIIVKVGNKQLIIRSIIIIKRLQNNNIKTTNGQSEFPKRD